MKQMEQCLAIADTHLILDAKRLYHLHCAVLEYYVNVSTSVRIIFQVIFEKRGSAKLVSAKNPATRRVS